MLEVERMHACLGDPISMDCHVATGMVLFIRRELLPKASTTGMESEHYRNATSCAPINRLTDALTSPKTVELNRTALGNYSGERTVP